MNKKTIRVLTIIIVIIGIASFFIDEQVLQWISNLRFSLLSELMKIITDRAIVGSVSVLLPIFILWYKNKAKWILPLILSLLTAIVLTYIFKSLFARPRPSASLIIVYFYSFPSGHAASVFSVIPAIEKGLKKLKWFWIVFACLIAFTRLYLGVHYLSDIIFGGLLGYLTGWFIINEGLKKWKIWN
ncbi:MAG: phosphatase PAP2 family protein [Hadesarchaea archaeon]|nr:phosphatase PAP2 family protein [Hadesarchaea archaeon]